MSVDERTRDGRPILTWALLEAHDPRSRRAGATDRAVPSARSIAVSTETESAMVHQPWALHICTV